MKAAAVVSAQAPDLPSTYEAALEELERLVERLESGNTPVDRLLGDYQRGAELLRYCRSRLAALEDQIKVLDGEALKPWQEDA